MKKSVKGYYVITLVLSFLFMLMQQYGFAQDTLAKTTTSSTTTSTTTNDQWYMQPWAWVVGGVVLLVILIALFSGGSKDTSKITVTKTVRTDVE